MASQIALLVGDVALDLEQSEISLNIPSPLFDDEGLPGAFAYTFRLPKTPHNCKTLGHIDIRAAVSAWPQYPACTLICYGQVFEGTLTSKLNGDKFEAHFTQLSTLASIAERELRDCPGLYSWTQPPLAGSGELVHNRLINETRDQSSTFVFGYDLPTLYMPQLFPEQDVTGYSFAAGTNTLPANYAGFVNYYRNQKYVFYDPVNHGIRYTESPLSPCVGVIYLLRKVCEWAGYELDLSSSALADDSLLGKLGFLSNKFFAMSRYNLGSINNIVDYPTGFTFDLKDYVPDATVADFLVMLRRAFGLVFNFNDQTKQCKIIRLQTNLSDLPRIILEDNRVEQNHEAEQSDETSTFGDARLKYSEGEDSLRLANAETFIYGQGTEPYDLGFDYMYEIQIADRYCDAHGITAPPLFVPMWGIEGTNQVYELDTEASGFRMVLVHGLFPFTGSLANKYPYASSDNLSGTYNTISLKTIGADSLVNEWLNAYFLLRGAPTIEVTYRALLSQAELALIRETAALVEIVIQGVPYLIKEVVISNVATDSGLALSELKLVQVPPYRVNEE